MLDRRYRCSEARNEALDRLRELKAGANAASVKSVPRSVRDMTYQSAIFQASSTLEEYIKQIFDHWIFELKKNKLYGKNIPEQARLSYLGREMRDMFHDTKSTESEQIFAKRLGNRLDLIEFVIGESTIPPYIDGSFAYKDKKYPSPKNIRVLYSRIGCDNVFNKLSMKMKSNAELKLQAFNDLRTSIAHGNPTSITLIDVRRNLDDVALFIKHLDRISHMEFSKEFGGGVW